MTAPNTKFPTPNHALTWLLSQVKPVAIKLGSGKVAWGNAPNHITASLIAPETLGHYTILKLEVFRDGRQFDQYKIDITEDQFRQPRQYWQNPEYRVLGNQQEMGWWWEKEGEFYLYPPDPYKIAVEVIAILQFHLTPGISASCRLSLDAATLRQVDRWFQEGDQQAELDIHKGAEQTSCPYEIDSAIHW